MKKRIVAGMLALALVLLAAAACAERVTLAGMEMSIELPEGWAVLEDSGETYYVAAMYDPEDHSYEMGLMAIVDDSVAGWDVQRLDEAQVSHLFALLQLDAQQEYTAKTVTQADGTTMLSLIQSGGASTTYDLFFIEENVVTSFYIYSGGRVVTDEMVQTLLQVVNSMESLAD